MKSTNVKNATLTAIVVLALASMALPLFVVSANAQTTPEQQPEDSNSNFSTRVNLSPAEGSAATMIVKATGMTSEGLNVEQEMVDETTFHVLMESSFRITGEESGMMESEEEEGNLLTSVTLSPTENSMAEVMIHGTGLIGRGIMISQEMVDENTFNVTVEGTFAITAEAVPAPEETAPVPGEEEQGASIIVSPPSGQVGSLVIVEGTGFEPNQGITMTIDNLELEMTMATPLTTDEAGDFPAIAATIPDIEAGEHEISATDDSGNSADTTFTVEGVVEEVPEEPSETTVASITSTPNVGPSGSEVTVDGTGFGVEENITFAFDDVDLDAIATADDFGVFSATIAIPADAADGDHSVSASDSLGNVATTTFTVEAAEETTVAASITASPSSGSAGSEVTIDGTGFGAGENVTFAFDGNSLNASVTADDLGSFSATAMIPVDASSGGHEISASDISGNTATATFTVEAI